MNRDDIATLICDRLRAEESRAEVAYRTSKSAIGHFVIDDLLPTEVASEIAAAFPRLDAMTAKRSLRERKAIMAQMASCSPLVEAAIYAFHDPRVLDLISHISGEDRIEADPFLYAGGISAMTHGDFLNPHLDNSHDKDRARWRALNLLYYVTPDWPEDCGGNLELWPDGIEGERVTIHSRFNRLAVMATHGRSWHSVSPITGQGTRMCVSNYYFTPEPILASDTFHVTSFRGRPEQPVRDLILRADAFARGLIRKLKPGGLAEVTHINKPGH